MVDGEEAVRMHHDARRELFTPLRAAGAPPVKGFTSARITEERFLDTGETFRRVDIWTARAPRRIAISADGGPEGRGFC